MAEALLQALGGDRAVVCPSFPENKRTVYQGYLFVGDRLLHETSMRSHPLTPMTDANLIRLMDAQSSRKSGWFRWKPSGKASKPSKPVWMNLRRKGTPWLVCDALSDADLRAIGAACAGHALVTGGSGVARGLGVNFGIGADGPVPPAPVNAPGLALVLAGSCSQATQAQVARFTRQRPGFALDPLALAEDHGGYVAEAVAFARRHCPEGRASSTPRPPRTGSPPRRPVSAGKPPEP